MVRQRITQVSQCRIRREIFIYSITIRERIFVVTQSVVNNPSVDNSVDKSYNDSNVDLLSIFKTYLEMNQDKPLREVVNEIIDFLKSEKATSPNETTD